MIKFMEKYLTLDEMRQEYPIVLVDTSAIARYWTIDPDKSNRWINDCSDQLRLNALSFFDRLSEEDTVSFYIIGGVYNELRSASKKKVKGKKDNRFKGGKRIKIRSNGDKDRGLTKVLAGNTRRLGNRLKSRGFVVDLSEEEKLAKQRFESEYFGLKGEYGLSEVDFEHLSTGAVLSKSRGSTALVSLDLPLVNSWKRLVREGGCSYSSLGFFLRKGGINSFERNLVDLRG